MRRLDRAHSLLLVVDVQDRMIRAQSEDQRRHAMEHMNWLRQIAGRCGVPILLAEQDARSQGMTIPQLSGSPELAHHQHSAVVGTDLLQRITASGRDQVVVVGMETHLAVAATVADLLDAGLQVWLVTDAVMDRKPNDAAVAIQRLLLQGALPTTTSGVLYGWVPDPTDGLFHELQRSLR
jgi:nicotinamidase-related amidase